MCFIFYFLAHEFNNYLKILMLNESNLKCPMECNMNYDNLFDV